MKTLGRNTRFAFSGIHIGRIIVFAFILLLSASAYCNADDHDEDEGHDEGHGGNNHKKMTICHKTSSGSHRYVTITINKSAWKKHRAHGDTKGPCDDDDEKCTLNITVIPPNVNLGNFFVGTTNELPSDNGSGNMLEFILRGGKKQSYDFDFDMELEYQMGPGKAKITRWTLEKADRSTRGRYGPAGHNRMGGYNDVRLCKQGGMGMGNKCGAIAKFRMTVQQLRITENAAPGSIKFSITIIATANI